MTRHDAQILHPWSQMDWQQQPVKWDMRWQMERPVIRCFWAAQAPSQTGREHNPVGTRNEGQAGNVLHTLWTLTLTSTRQQQLAAATFHFISFHFISYGTAHSNSNCSVPHLPSSGNVDSAAGGRVGLEGMSKVKGQ